VKWLELSIKAPSEMVEPLSALFLRHGHGGVVVEEAGGFNPDNDEAPPPNREGVVKVYLPVDGTLKSRREGIDVGLRLFSLVRPLPPLVETEIDETDWTESWKSHFPVLHVGKRIVVKPAWHEYTQKPGEVIVHLDPGMAFGTGHHPTTRMCLEQLEKHLVPGAEVLDFGAGSAVLSIAAVHLGAARSFGLEIDALAVKSATANIVDNGLQKQIIVVEGSLPHHGAPAGGFDLALCNVSTKVLRDFALRLAEALRPRAFLIASGFTLDQEERTLEGLRQAPLSLIERAQEEDWVSVVMQKDAAGLD
jgi:ribosomal protein L11 methyltransferase